MTRYSDLSIKTKLSIIALLTCVTALGLACAALFFYEVHSFQNTLVSDMKAQATVLAKLSSAALTFDDPRTETEMLNEFNNQKHIRWAVVFKDETRFAQYKRSDLSEILPEAPPDTLNEWFVGDGLYIHQPIEVKGDRLGSLYICAETSQLRKKLAQYAEILLLVFVAASVVALAMASRLQRSIVGPVQRLADSARLIAEKQDYSVRVDALSHDELGRLTAAFNQMLNRIQAQDADLREERERFEIAVAGARDGIWDWNMHTNEMYLSMQWKAILGYPDHELRINQEGWLDLLHPEDREATIKMLHEYLSGNRATYEIEYRMRHVDGSYRWIFARGAALRDNNGKPYRMAGSHTDITERKLAEEELNVLNKRLIETSRMAGMAEVATGVLHNVGNVLNSVNVSASMLRDRLKQTRLPNLTRALALMREHADDLGTYLTTDPKGRQLPQFLEMLKDHLFQENRQLLDETDSLDRNVQHIKEIVSAQQSHARVYGANETLEARDLMEDTVRINEVAFARHGVRLTREFAPVPPVIVDRHKVMQILINLMRNAKQSLIAHERQDKLITLGIAPGSEGRVRLFVTDNGGGISPENLIKVFRHGFTTKKDGHGFGLHSCANAAKEMRGSLTVHSDGIGRGATFTLELPTARRQGSSNSTGASTVTTGSNSVIAPETQAA